MKKILKYLSITLLIFIIGIFGVNLYVKISTNKYITDINSNKLNDSDAILVLGAAVWEDKPSPMLKDRLDTAINLYKNNPNLKIIMSGDHTKTNYDEVNVMKNYATNKGINSKDIFMDHAGISTYDSIYRAKNIFKAKKVIIVTQKYHLYHSLYIAKELNLDAVGVPAVDIKYSGQIKREVREILAREKDFLKCIYKPSSKYLGDEISLSYDGNITND